MKIAVTGKGGVGKTTFAAVLSRLYADEGKNVLCADVDPDANLGLALGFKEEELESIIHAIGDQGGWCDAQVNVDEDRIVITFGDEPDDENEKGKMQIINE